MKTLTISGFDYEIENRIPKIGEYWVYICKYTKEVDSEDFKQPNNLTKSWFDKLHDKDCYNAITATNDPELIKQGVPELTPAESTNEVKTVGREIYHPMWKRPNQSKDDITFSETVIVYGVKFHKEDLDISEIDDSVMGYFNFEKQEWFVLCDESLKLICWTYVPNPQQFMKDKFRDWKVELHNGYRP